jgi:5-methylthioadenosine/S-adenosylhomocysteine deaminase
MKKVDLIIKNGSLLRCETDIDSIAINNGRIIDIDSYENISNKYKAKKTLNAKGKLIIPGFVNAHSHISMSYLKGIADDLPLMDWLQNHIWPIENKFMCEEYIYNAALHGACEMIKNGITSFNDMYFFGDFAAQASEKAGLRAVIGEGILDFPVANYNNADEIFAYIKRMNEKYKESDFIDFAVAPHAIYTCGKENLIKAKDLAGKLDILLHIHLSETEFEVQECLKKTGKTPVEYLDSIGFFEGNVIAAHGIWVNEEEMHILAQRNVSVAVNTKSNLKLASGFAPIKQYLSNGVNICLGTDGVASNNNLSMFEEMRITSGLHKTLNNDPTFLPAEEMVKTATINGAVALNKENEIGSIEVGKKADLVLIETDNICTQPLYDAYSHLVYSITSEQIKDVIINGKIVMQNRKIVNIEEDEIVEKANYYRAKIKKDLDNDLR